MSSEEPTMSRRRALFAAILVLPSVALVGLWYWVNGERRRFEAIEAYLAQEDKLRAGLPEPIRLGTKFKRTWVWGPKGEIITVRQRLTELGAYLENGKL